MDFITCTECQLSASFDPVGVCACDENFFFDEITDSLTKGERVELRGFGAFSVKKRPARTGRNPRTGEPVHVEEKHVPFFKTGKELRDRVNTSMLVEQHS